MHPSGDALALLEVDGVACGLRVLDALVKQAPVTVLEANLIEPGRFLILFAGGVAEVDEASRAGASAAGALLLDQLNLARVHGALVPGLRGLERRGTADALDTVGIVEGNRIASVLLAADCALKQAFVSLVGVRIAGALGGRGYFIVHGAQHDVEAGLAAAKASLEARGALHRIECIARPHDEMVEWLLRRPPFALAPLES